MQIISLGIYRTVCTSHRTTDCIIANNIIDNNSNFTNDSVATGAILIELCKPILIHIYIYIYTQTYVEVLAHGWGSVAVFEPLMSGLEVVPRGPGLEADNTITGLPRLQITRIIV